MMTIEEKAKVYDDALERAKKAIIDCGDNEGRKRMIYGIFPEMNPESEDEKIRKEMIEFFQCSMYCDDLDTEKIKRWVAYLEKSNSKDFPTTDEEMKTFLATHPKVEVPERYKKPDWVFEQPVCDGFDGEFSKFSNDVDAEHPFPICVDEYKDFARHFAQWQKEQMMKDAVEGWVAIDKRNNCNLYRMKPKRARSRALFWTTEDCCSLPISASMFPKLKWEDEPKKVRIIICKKED